MSVVGGNCLRAMRGLTLGACLLAWGGGSLSRRAADAAEAVSDAEALLRQERIRIAALRNEVDQTLSAAREAKLAGRYADARGHYLRARQLDPSSDEANAGVLEMDRRLASTRTPANAVADALATQRIQEESSVIAANNALSQARALLAEASAPPAPREIDTVESRPGAWGRRKQKADEADSRLQYAYAQYKALPPQRDTAQSLLACEELRRQIAALRNDLDAKIYEANQEAAGKAVRESRADSLSVQNRNIELWRDNAERAIKSQNYPLARQYLAAILMERDYDKKARTRLDEVNKMDLSMRSRANEMERVLKREMTQNQVDKKTYAIPMPPGKIMEFPVDWPELLTKLRARERNRDAAQDETTVDIYRKLQEWRSVEFNEASLEDFREWLADQTGLLVVVDYDVKDVMGQVIGQIEDKTLTFQVSDMRLEAILDYATRVTDMAWTPRNGGIIIRAAGQGATNLVTKSFDIKDLNPSSERFKTSRYNLNDSDNSQDDQVEEDVELEAEYRSNSIVDMIRRKVMKYVFDKETVPTAVGSLTYDRYRGIITATAPQRDMDTLERLLLDIRAVQQLQVSTVVRFLQIEDSFWEEFSSSFAENVPTTPQTGLPVATSTMSRKDVWTHYHNGMYGPPADGRPRPPLYGPDDNGDIGNNARAWWGFSSMTTAAPYNSVLTAVSRDYTASSAGLTMSVTGFGWLGKTNARWLLRAIHESTKADNLYAPHVVCYNNNPGEVRRLRVVQEAIPRASSSGQGVSIRIEDYVDGIILAVQPVVSADRRYITVSLRPQMNIVDENPAVTSWIFSDDVDNIIFHTVLVNETQTYATIPNGGTVLMSGMAINIHMQARKGVPLVQDIPVFGNLFSRRILQRDKLTYVNMVSADIIAMDDEEAKVGAAVTVKL